MKTKFLLALLALAIAVPGMAGANCYAEKHSSRNSDSHAYSDENTAVAGYAAVNDSSHPSTAEVDQARIAEYKSIFGEGGMVAGYSATSWRPWANEGTWVTVNGERMWATEGDFVWMNDRWMWADDSSATFTFEDDRFDVDSETWGIDNDRFDMDVDRDKFDVDPDRFNLDEDRSKIETDID